MRRLIFFALLILAGVVAYTYYFGKGEDQEQAREIVHEAKELGKSVGDFLKTQKGKYDDGEFDQLLDKVAGFVEKLKTKDSTTTQESEEEIKAITNELKQVDPTTLTEEQKEKLRNVLKELENREPRNENR